MRTILDSGETAQNFKNALCKYIYLYIILLLLLFIYYIYYIYLYI